MPSVTDDSPGTTRAATPRSIAPETPGNTDPLSALIVESERAVDRLVASTDWAAHDAALAELAAQSDAAMHHYHLLLQQGDDDVHAVGSGPAVPQGTGDTTT